jgi:hypothetical protein
MVPKGCPPGDKGHSPISNSQLRQAHQSIVELRPIGIGREGDLSSNEGILLENNTKNNAKSNATTPLIPRREQQEAPLASSVMDPNKNTRNCSNKRWV